MNETSEQIPLPVLFRLFPNFKKKCVLDVTVKVFIVILRCAKSSVTVNIGSVVSAWHA